MALLENIRGGEDIRRLDQSRLPELAREVRERMVDVISQIGGHFAPGLGVVELTIALHYVLDTPRDQIVWDVGHQGYPHKILTGRSDELARIRQKGGISGFLRRDESEYDTFGAGHAATSISAGLGMATARDLRGEDFKVAAVIGDGAMTSGMAYEALNNAGHTHRDLIVVLNDNEMSISPNVGAMHKYLTRISTNPIYNRLREELKGVLQKSPKRVEEWMIRLEESMKNMLVPGTLFEELGFRYFGPVDGHDMDAVVDVLRKVRGMKGPRLVHVITQKGKGFALAEQNPVVWHGASPFDKISGETTKKKGELPAYTKAFGTALMELADAHPEMAVITAAMSTGTGTAAFGDAYPDRFFDVGIAEGHAVTFAAGLATQGIRPVAAIYSTFLQRAYDSIIHDVAIQKLPVVFAMDRAGLVGNDGPTHMGLYDIAYLLAVPNVVVTAPKDGTEMAALLRMGVRDAEGPFTLRYPRDNVPGPVPPMDEIPEIAFGSWETLRRGRGLAILAVGTMVHPALLAAEALASEGIDATVVNCRFLKPIDADTLSSVLADHRAVLTVEEGTIVNGFGAMIATHVEAARRDGADVHMDVMGVPDVIIEHAARGEQLEQVGLTPAGIADRARYLARSARLEPVRELA